VYAIIFLFPITQGLSELSLYFGYVMPRLESGGLNKILALSLPALMLGLQHIAVPFLFDIRFILWRALMYIPFAFFSGIVLHWRPRLLPYMAIVHVLMNMSFATMFLSVAY
jgi:membrane protease YdiL (CAAX protease family)